MSDYTPTTDEMRNVYASAQALGIRSGPPGAIEYNHGKAKFDRWLAEVERAAAARALEEFADQMTTGFNAGTLNAERRAIKREARARAEAYTEGKLT